MKIAVLGAGIGGLSAASRLSSLGHEVILLEKNNIPGGKASIVRLKGYTFDAGPSLFTAPQWLDDVFLSCGKNPRDYYSFKELKLITRYFFQDSTCLDVFNDLQKTAKSIEENTKYPSFKFIKQMKHWEKVYKLSEKTFLLGKLTYNIYFFKAVVKWFFQIGIKSIYLSMAQFNKRAVNNLKVELILNRFATYTGSSPYKTPAFMNQLAVVEMCNGAFYPKGGIFSIPKALEKLAIDVGVDLIYNNNVSSVVHIDKGWKVISSNKNLIVDLVISNIDYFLTQTILGRKYKINEKNLSTSGIVFYWGISKIFNKLKLHNVFFSEDYELEFEQIENEKKIPQKPTVYVNISSKLDSHHAKEGCENWFVMINVPPSLDLVNSGNINKIKKSVLSLLSKQLNEDIESLIECEQILTPNTLFHNTGAYNGSIYGENQNSLNKIMRRKPNKDNIRKGIYYVGGTFFTRIHI